MTYSRCYVALIMEEINNHINSLSKEDLVRVLGNLKNAEIGKDMLMGLGFSERAAKEIDNIMETCEILCIPYSC